MTPMAPPARPTPQADTGYRAFLQQQLATQPHNVMAHVVGDEQIWVKRAGAPHGVGRYRAMAVLARVLRLEVLRPVPNPGGPAAIATEVRRLQDLAARGLRVPAVLAVQADGFAMRHLGRPGEDTPSLGNEIEHAARQGDSARALALWQQGLDTLAQVHRQGTCLSQAFARNMVRCPDGAVACIDFEDDPAAVLPLAVCQARDALCYAHSTAIYLGVCRAWSVESENRPQRGQFLPDLQAHSTAMGQKDGKKWTAAVDLQPTISKPDRLLAQGAPLQDARRRWAAWVAQGSQEMQVQLATSVRRMGWMRHLPTSRSLGRDLQRVRAAYDLLND